jgi:parallel beta-helix repeat protein
VVFRPYELIWGNRFLSSTCISACLVALAGVVSLPGLLGKPASALYNAPVSMRPATVTTVCASGCDHDTIQGAVDAANDGDVVKVAAGTYTSLSVRSEITQVVYISKSITLQGGYTVTDWSTAYPFTQPTTLDAQGGGRVIYITGDISPTLAGLRIMGGNAAGLGGMMNPGGPAYDVGGGVYVVSATVTLSNNTILSNTAATGGGLYLYGSRPILAGNMISANMASLYDGGGLYMDKSTAGLNGNMIVANTAGGGHGGGLYLSASSISLGGNTLSGNMARYSGGGAYLLGSEVTVSGNDLTANTAGGYGGGLYVGSSAATFNANTLSANTAGGRGGGLYLDYSDNAGLAGNTILLNTANGSVSADGGGGIWVQDSNNVTLDANVILSNTASLNCGGLSLNSGSATLTGNTLTANAAGGNGGGLCVAAGAAVVNTNSISGNTAYLGGGLYGDGSSITLNRSSVLSNTASDSGGGLYLYRSEATLVNSVVADNQASGAGSGLYVRSSSPRLVHTTLARNHGGDGSGLYITGEENVEDYSPSTVVLTNVILVSHTVGITVTGGNTATVNGVLWYATPLTVSTAPTATAVVENEYIGDPAFAADGFHLRSSSAAIDRGVEASVTDDIDGDRRPYGNGYDLGADEWTDWRFVYLPVVLRQAITRD